MDTDKKDSKEPLRRTMATMKDRATFLKREEGDLFSKNLPPFVHHKNKNGGPLSRHKPFDPNDPDDPLKPGRLYSPFYSKYRYPDVVPAINQASYCPFDPHHKYHMGQYGPSHLVKCKLNNPITSSYFDVCDFNKSHYVPKGKMREHLNNCRAHLVWANEQAIKGLPMTLDKAVAVGLPKAEIPKEEAQEELCFTWDEDAFDKKIEVRRPYNLSARPYTQLPK